jgi:hypothetical protein
MAILKEKGAEAPRRAIQRRCSLIQESPGDEGLDEENEEVNVYI